MSPRLQGVFLLVRRHVWFCYLWLHKPRFLVV